MIVRLLCAAILLLLTGMPAAAALRIVVSAQFADRLPAPPPPQQRLAPALDAAVRLDGRLVGFTIPEGLAVIDIPSGGAFGAVSASLSDPVRFPQVALYAGQPIDQMTELIVVYRPNISVAALPPAIAGLSVKDRHEQGRYVVLDATNVISSSTLLPLLADPRVRFIEPSYHYVLASPSPPNDPDWVNDHPDLWGLRLIKAAVAWQTVHESPIRVAIVDSGIEAAHPDLGSNLWRNQAELIGSTGLDDDHNGCVDDVYGCDFIENDGVPQDWQGHGTQVAGVIGAVGNNAAGTVGVVWGISMMPVRVFTTLYVDPNIATKGIDYAVANGARVINASWSGRNSQSVVMSDAITRADNAGALLVAATGNNGSNLDDPNEAEYPAAYAHGNIVAVLATDNLDAAAGGSGYGATSVDLGAPGSAVRSTTIGKGYTQTFGTSFAAPYVSGALALAWAAQPGLTAHQVRQLILDKVVVLPALAGKCATSGRLDLGFLRPSERPQKEPPAPPQLIDVTPLPE